MKKLLLALALLCAGTIAMAGPNAGGTLIAALSEGTVYSGDDAPYCGSATTPDCESAVVRVDTNGVVVWNVLAAFASGSSPRLKGITFGIDYDSANLFLVDNSMCGDFELPDPTWPDPGTGNAVTWAVAQTTLLTDVYWFAGYDYYSVPTSFDLIASPTQGADFADDDIPANLDPIACLGSLGFFQDGLLCCPSPDVPGACCFDDGSCQVVLEIDCDALGGTWFGDPSCTPNPCPVPAIGACCIGDVCVLRTAQQCADQGGDYQGDDVPCDPNPCIPIPTIETTWGQIKSNYR